MLRGKIISPPFQFMWDLVSAHTAALSSVAGGGTPCAYWEIDVGKDFASWIPLRPSPPPPEVFLT